jgi:16S rRNA (adenine1518-N6/adenine1519-N6)-dimethyltransferase
VELDRDLLPGLQQTYSSATLHEGDAATLSFADFVNDPWVFVSNLPYNAGNAILMNVLTTIPAPRRAVVMLQKEVGERIAFTEPKNRGVLGLAVQSYAHVEKVWIVPPGAFTPPPKVDSMVLVLEPKKLTAPQVIEAEAVIALAKVGFAHRRQQLQKTLGGQAGHPSSSVADLLQELGHTKSARPQELTLADWFKLNSLLRQNSKPA